jgi:hypothetical protein
MSEQPQRMIEISSLIQLTKATSLGSDLFPEDKIEKSHEKTIYPIAYGIKLQRNFTTLQASTGIAEVISVTLFIGKNVALTIACGLVARYLYDKLNKHKDKVAGLMIRKKGVKNNPNDIAQAFLEEIERLEKDKE